ncbi:membrane protein [Endozoicomonas numazuensis]|uniref:Membrane protein n=1 Tax=Endozoicomonas numazuensis TaxID=1137799 RepID=A0A081NMW4_9GAMM|nr:membrane protein [Endozoicomonas numazuensis]
MKQAGIVFLLSLSLTGCMTDQTGTTYSASEARQMQTVLFGTVAESRLVKLEGTQGEVGTLAGAAVGGITGSSIGGQRESAIAAVAGAVAGGVLGSMAEKKITAKQGVELTVRLDDGSYVSVVQQVDPAVNFASGDKVKILTQGSTSRVVKVQ